MSNLLPREIALIAIVLLAFAGAAVVLALAVAKYLSTDASWWLGRSMRLSEAKTRGGLHDGDDAKEPVEGNSVRASDADRDRTTEKLREEAAQGRLMISEFEERMESARYAKTLGELARLMQDLPSGRV